MIVLPVVLAALAQEHAAPEVAKVAPVAADIPEGPPRDVSVAPGEDLQAAIRALPAGSTVRLGPGDHAGPLFVDRPLVLEGKGAILRGKGEGTVLILAADDCAVRDLHVTGGGDDPTAGDAGVLIAGDRAVVERVRVTETLIGVDFREADDGVLRDSEIRGWEQRPLSMRGDGVRLWESYGNRVERNRLVGVRDLVVWYSARNVVVDNEVRDSRYGTHFMHADDNAVERNRYIDDVVGVFVMYSEAIALRDNLVTGADGAAGMGFGFKESNRTLATGNRLVGNTTGVYLDGTPHRIGGDALFQDNVLAFNDVGVRFHGGSAGARFLANDIHENGVQVAVDGNADATRHTFQGNRWSDYAGYDLDRDGYGDLPYELRSFTGGLVQRRPAMRFFTGTVAAGLLDLLATAFPMFAPRALLTDARPEMG